MSAVPSAHCLTALSNSAACHPSASWVPQVCPLTVPKYLVFKAGADEDGYLKQLGYRIRTDEDTGQVREWRWLLLSQLPAVGCVARRRQLATAFAPTKIQGR